MDGNACARVLELLDDLETRLDDHLKIYLIAFRTFDAVRKACFTKELDRDNYKIYIENFRIAYMNLGIAITPKAHIIFDHLGEFCERYDVGLGSWSEQARQVYTVIPRFTWFSIMQFSIMRFLYNMVL